MAHNCIYKLKKIFNSDLKNLKLSLALRLKKRKNGRVLAAGFQLPEHAAAEDFSPWVAQDKGWYACGQAMVFFGDFASCKLALKPRSPPKEILKKVGQNNAFTDHSTND